MHLIINMADIRLFGPARRLSFFNFKTTPTFRIKIHHPAIELLRYIL